MYVMCVNNSISVTDRGTAVGELLFVNILELQWDEIKIMRRCYERYQYVRMMFQNVVR